MVRRIRKVLAGNTAEAARAARFHPQKGRSELGDVGKVSYTLCEAVAYTLILCVLGLESPDEGGAINMCLREDAVQLRHRRLSPHVPCRFHASHCVRNKVGDVTVDGRYWGKVAIKHFRDHGGVCCAWSGWGSHDLCGAAYSLAVVYKFMHGGHSRRDSDANDVTCVLDDHAHVSAGLRGWGGGPFPVGLRLFVDRAL